MLNDIHSFNILKVNSFFFYILITHASCLIWDKFTWLVSILSEYLFTIAMIVDNDDLSTIVELSKMHLGIE